MKQFLKNIVLFIIAPFLAVVALSAAAVRMAPAPAPITVPESRESWWDPTSWGLDEAAADAAAMANQAQAGSAAFSVWTVGLSALGIGVAASALIGFGHRADLKLPKKAAAPIEMEEEVEDRNFPAQKPPTQEQIDAAAEGRRRRGHPAPTGG